MRAAIGSHVISRSNDRYRSVNPTDDTRESEAAAVSETRPWGSTDTGPRPTSIDTATASSTIGTPGVGSHGVATRSATSGPGTYDTCPDADVNCPPPGRESANSRSTDRATGSTGLPPRDTSTLPSSRSAVGRPCCTMCLQSSDLYHLVRRVGVVRAPPESDRGKGWGMDDRLRTTRPELGPALRAPCDRGEGVSGAV